MGAEKRNNHQYKTKNGKRSENTEQGKTHTTRSNKKVVLETVYNHPRNILHWSGFIRLEFQVGLVGFLSSSVDDNSVSLDFNFKLNWW